MLPSSTSFGELCASRWKRQKTWRKPRNTVQPVEAAARPTLHQVVYRLGYLPGSVSRPANQVPLGIAPGKCSGQQATRHLATRQSSPPNQLIVLIVTSLGSFPAGRWGPLPGLPRPRLDPPPPDMASAYLHHWNNNLTQQVEDLSRWA